MSLPAFSESRFRAQVDKSLVGIRNILDHTRTPQFPADVQHGYDDKFGLAEFLANMSIAAGHECLAQLGLHPVGMAQLVEWARERNVTLRLSAEETCSFLREVTRDVESASSVVRESTLFGKSTTKVVTKVTEYFWQFTSKWQISAFVGTGAGEGERVLLSGRTGQCEITTSSKVTPRVEKCVRDDIDVSIAWLLRHTTDDMSQLPTFEIDRTATESCRTPRRNNDIDAAFDFWESWHSWSTSVRAYLRNDLISIQRSFELDLASLTDAEVFMPVVALFEEGRKGPCTKPGFRAARAEAQVRTRRSSMTTPSAAALAVLVPDPHKDGSALLPETDADKFLSEQRRTLAEKVASIAKTFPSAAQGKLASVVEAGVIMMCTHVQRLAQSFVDGVDSIELMLRRQLIAAVGRELTAFDFAQYMRYHYRKLYRPHFEPRPFCYAIRRPDHYPEGTVSIESTSPGDGGAAGLTPEPILTHVRKVEPAFPMHFAINAATNVVFNGDRYLHGWVSHQFAGQSTPSLSLNCRARQFSCFLVLVGTIGSASLFLPKHAIILQNKDDLSIPLNLETLPTAKEFKDAIESMSPEQQRFAQAIRSMQLEGSMFGVCIIQLKPQLEKLLRLPDDSLTKEIRLTQDLLELFIKYQIPSDLLSYEGEAGASATSKVSQVARHVHTMQTMLADAKAKEIADLAAEALAARLAAEAAAAAAYVPPPPPEPQLELESLDWRADSLQSEAHVFYRSAPKKKGGFGFLSAVGKIFSGGGGDSSSSRSINSSMMMSAPSSSSSSSSSSMERKRRSSPPTSAKARAPAPASAPAPAPAPVAAAAAPVVVAAAVAAPVVAAPAAEPAPAAAVVAAAVVAPTPVSPGEVDSSSSSSEANQAVAEEEEEAALDWTTLPVALDKKLMELDTDAALRSTIITAGGVWSKRSQKSILAPPSTASMGEPEQTLSKQEAFDLLDALSRSGVLSIDCAELHIVIAATHCFDESLIDTVIQRNVNPIEKVERSSLLLATTVQDAEASLLIKPDQKDRVKLYNEKLFLGEAQPIANGAVARV